MWFNPIMLWLLYSPLHGIISDNTLVINFSGKKSGKKYQVPIGYAWMGDTLITSSYKRRTWWRNMRGGTDVILRLKGKDVAGHSEVVEDELGVMEGLKALIGGSSLWASRLGVIMTPDGQLDEASLRAAAEPRVIVCTTLK